MDDDGIWHENRGGMENVVVSYFTNLFTSNGATTFDDILDNITPTVTEEMNIELGQTITDDEVKITVFQMHYTKTQGPDGMSHGFCKKHCGKVGSDVFKGICEMVALGHILRKINYTHVTLISKVKEATKMSQFCPISLCNVLYKIMVKVLANILKVILPKIISPTHSAFIPGS